jgi:hypothetical protein
MSQELEPITQNQDTQRPVPSHEEKENNSGHGERDPCHMNPEIERVAVPFQPILENSP